MKKVYKKPIIVIEELHVTDIIATSIADSSKWTTPDKNDFVFGDFGMGLWQSNEGSNN